MLRSCVAVGLGLILFASAADLPVLVKTDSVQALGEGWSYKGLVRTVELATAPGDTTDGDGSIHLAAHTAVQEGNHYTSFWLTLPEPVDLRQKRLLFDAKSAQPATQAFYVRLYNRGENKPAWSFNSWNGLLQPEWQTFGIQEGLCYEGLAWEAGVCEGRQATAVERVEFLIGTHDDEADIEVFVDNLRVAPRLVALADLAEYKTILPTTPLVQDGQAVAVVLHPDTPAGVAAAATVVTAIKERTGVALTARPGTAADREIGQPAILLGDVFSNPAMLLLYARRLVPADAVCPGEGGALLRTVYDPFGKGANLLVLGAHDEAGLAKAAEEFTKLVAGQPAGQTLAMSRVFASFYSPEFLKQYPYADDPDDPKRLEEGLAAGRRNLERGTHTSIAGELARVAQRYQLTGHASEAKLFVALCDLYAESAVGDPRKYGGPWGFDSDFPSQTVVPGWDLIEEDPSLTDEERLRTVKHLGRWLAEAVVPKCAGAVGSTHVLFNHQTFPALGTLLAGLYLTQGFEVAEGRLWLGMGDAIFRRQATYYKSHEDCNGYQWLTNGHLFTYALARPDFTVFENGNGRRIIDFLIGNMDNLAIQVPYGDTGSWQCWNSELVCLDTFGFATGDPDAAWAGNLKRERKKVRRNVLEFALPETQNPTPTRFNGVRTWPLEPAFYATFPEDNRPPLAACFDKVTFRERMDPQAAYLLLDGIGTGGHKHFDANSIPRITQFERIWLADNDYYKSPIKFHNSLMVFKDGQSGPMPSFVELIGSGESPRYGYSLTRVSGYAGVDWERAIVWLKPTQSFVVLDRLTAVEPDEYQFRLLWHGVGDATLAEDGLALRQQGPGMRIQLAPGPVPSLVNDADLGTNWSGYPYAEPVVRSFSSTATVRLAKGESYLFATVLHGAADGLPPVWRLQFPAGIDGLVADTPQGRLAVGLGPFRGPAAGGVFVTDAQIMVADGGLSLLGATRATFDNDILHESAEPVCVELDNAPTYDALDGLAARPPTPNLVAGTEAPALVPVWQVKPQPKDVLVTGNADTPGALTRQPVLASDPEPAAQNVLGPDKPNRLSALLDGSWKSTENCVVFEPDRNVTLTIHFAGPVAVSRVAWKAWWAEASSRQTAYRLAAAEVSLSNDDFQQDRRAFGSLRDEGPHPSWGSPRDYEVTGTGTATAIRLELTPHPGTAVYLAELYVVGGAPEGETTVAYDVTRLAASRDALLVGTGGGDLLALDPATGKVQRTTRFGGAVNDVAVADLDGDGSEEVVVGRRDYWLTVLAADFTERWSRELKYYRSPPSVNLVRTGDLDGDGKPEVVCGGENWRFYAFSGAGDELWNYESVHASRSGVVADLDGDGKAEVVCGTHYYWMSVVNGQGLPQWKASFGPICRDVAVGNFDGDRTRGVIFGAGDGCLHYYSYDGKKRLSYNTGDEVVSVLALDLDGDGRDEFVGASLNQSVYAFNAQGERLWRTDLGSPPVRLVALPANHGTQVAAIAQSGRVVVLAGTGQVVARLDLGTPLVDALVRERELIVADAAGQVSRLRLPQEN